MAYPQWLTVSPSSGSGDGTLSISAVANTGRNSRSYGNGTSTGIKVVAGSITRYIKVTQAAKTEFVSIDKAEYSVAYNATTVTITGKSNSSRLTFSLKNPSGDITDGKCQMVYYEGSTEKGSSYKGETAKYIQFKNFSASDVRPLYTADGSDCASGADISGDPGASYEYAFSITLNFNTANTASAQEWAFLKVTTKSGSDANTTIKRNAASVFMEVYAEAAHTTKITEIGLSTAGTAKNAYIDSNGSWTVSGT